MRFADWPLRQKLWAALALSCLVALLVAGSAILLYEAQSFQPNVVRELESLGAVLVEMTRPAVLFLDPDLAREYLNVLRLYPQIDYAVLLQPDLQVFAQYGAGTAPQVLPARPGVEFTAARAVLWLPLQTQTDSSWLYLSYRLPAWWQRLPQYSIMALALTLSLVLITLLLWQLSGRYLLRPLLQITAYVRHSRQTDTVRAPLEIRQQDELGALAQAFNQLLQQVSSQNQQLREQLGQQQQTATRLQVLTDELAHSNADLQQALEISKAGYWQLELRQEPWWYQSSPRLAALCGDPAKADWCYPLSHWFSQIAGADAQQEQLVRDRFTAALAPDAEEFDCSYPYLRAIDGQRIWLHTIGRVIRDSAGRAVAMHAVTQDITENKQAEQLETERAAAQAASVAKSAFLANMSHEIRTPMNAILGLSHLALRCEPEPLLRQYLQKVQQAARSLLGIINDILDFSKIEAGRLEIEQTELDLEQVLQQVTTVTAAKAAEKQLEYLIDLDPNVPRQLLGDPLRLGQVLTNLVSNAIKFTESGEVRLQIRLEPNQTAASEQAQLLVQFSVSDTGIGMSESQQQALFQPFSQADQSTTRQFGGTGLGLSISQRLVELMGGRIWCQSQPGQGSTFGFELQMRAAGKPAVLSGPLGLRVLVVDDHALTCEILQQQLQALGCEADTVLSAAEAITQVEQAQAAVPYDLVLTDWRMPALDGVALCRKLKQQLSLPVRPQVILITAFGAEDLQQQAFAAGADAVLAKPVNASTLYDTLLNLRQGTAGMLSPALTQLPDLPGVRFLVTEDNEINRQIASELLLQCGASVDCAEDGAQALELLQQHGPGYYQLVLMDLQMPVMDGHQAIARIRQWPAFDNLPVVAMTAHAMSGEKQQCLDEGMNDHIAKPVDPEQFYQVITRQLSQHGWQIQLKTAESENTTQQLPELLGFDTHSALRRIGGDLPLYLNLLHHFATDYHDWPARLMHLAAAADWPALLRDCHLLKGVAGNIGALDVAKAAALAELRLRQQQPDPAELYSLLSALARTLLEASQRLQPLLKTVQTVHTSVMPLPQALAKIRHLHQLYQQADASAGDLFDSLNGVLQQHLNPPAFLQLEKATANFDYPAAAEILQSWLQGAIPEQNGGAR